MTLRTAPGEADDSDFRMWGPAAAGPVLERWERFREAAGMDTVVHARQVHGAAVRLHRGGWPGLHLPPASDGHLTAEAGVLLTVALADCVPIFLVAPERRAVGLLHAGWRGVAAGIVEAGIRAFDNRLGIDPEELHVHLGPAISKEAYEVGPEVHRALGLPEREVPALLDLRSVIAERAARHGVEPGRLSVSRRCTRRDPRLFSHRGGDEGRHVAFIGVARSLS